MSVTVTLVDFCTERERVLGTWEWVQVTYDVLRAAPDGEQVAFQTEETRSWLPTGSVELPYSDFIISSNS